MDFKAFFYSFVFKKLKLKYIASFLLDCLFGKILDLISVIFLNFNLRIIYLRFIIFEVGMTFTVIGVLLLIKDEFHILLFDTFIKK